MNKINIQKLDKKDIEQSFYEDDDESVRNAYWDTNTLMRVNTHKTMISVDVENINNYFKDYRHEADWKYKPESTIETEILMSQANSKRKISEEFYFLTNCVGCKNIFEEFITIGIETEGLEYTDLNELYLTPKITANYPNNLAESELKL
jgi:hypothetical protein